MMMNISGKKILLTGVAGFKCAYLAKSLAYMGAKVYGIYRNRMVEPQSSFHILNVNEMITTINCDITDKVMLNQVINKISPEIIVHMAAQAIVPSALRDPVNCYEVNVIGTLNLLESARTIPNVERILIASTDHVFGATDFDKIPPKGFPENSSVSYGGPYDTSKSCMELAIQSYIYSYDLPPIIITRCSNVFGPGDCNSRRLIPMLCDNYIKGIPLPPLYKNCRQFIYIEDAISGYIKALCLSQELLKPLNVFHFTLPTYKDNQPYICIQDVKNIFKKMPKAILKDDLDEYAPFENPVQALDCTLTESILGFKAKYLMEQGIKELLCYMEADNTAARTYLADLIIKNVIKRLE